MSALGGLAFALLALVGATRVVKLTIATSRRALARFGRFLASLEGGTDSQSSEVSRESPE